MSRLFAHAAALSALLLSLGCAKEQPAPRRTAPWLASASPDASAPSGTERPGLRRSFRFTPESSLRFSLPARSAKPTGRVPVLDGKLELDLADLASARARIDADLLRLTLDTDSVPSEAELGDVDPSLLALRWLELGNDVPRERRDQFARARFELSSLEGSSERSLSLDTKRPKRVRVTAVGTLLLHGFRAPVRVELAVQVLPNAADAPAPGPLRLSIRSVSPLVLPLAPHDIGPRSAAGVLEPREAARAEGSVGKSARIDIELVAESTDP